MPPILKNVTCKFLPVRSALGNDPKALRLKALGLYRAWYRQIPGLMHDYKMPLSDEEVRSKLREIYVKNSKIQDPKVINALIMKGEMELNESVNYQKEACHLYKYFREEPTKNQTFLTKFLEGR